MEHGVKTIYFNPQKWKQTQVALVGCLPTFGTLFRLRGYKAPCNHAALDATINHHQKNIGKLDCFFWHYKPWIATILGMWAFGNTMQRSTSKPCSLESHNHFGNPSSKHHLELVTFQCVNMFYLFTFLSSFSFRRFIGQKTLPRNFEIWWSHHKFG